MKNYMKNLFNGAMGMSLFPSFEGEQEPSGGQPPAAEPPEGGQPNFTQLNTSTDISLGYPTLHPTRRPTSPVDARLLSRRPSVAIRPETRETVSWASQWVVRRSFPMEDAEALKLGQVRFGKMGKQNSKWPAISSHC